MRVMSSREQGGVEKSDGSVQAQGSAVVFVSSIVTRLINGAVVLLTIYGKNVKETIPAHILQRIAEELGHATP